MPRRKKKATRKSRKKTAKRVTITVASLKRLEHLGASHHAALTKLKKTVRYVHAKKKGRKKTGKKRTRRR